MKKFTTDVKVYPVRKPFEKTFMVHETVKATVVGQYAMELARVGMQMGTEETRFGGIKRLRMMSVDFVVKRACDMAEAMFNEMEQRGLLVQLPDLVELEGEDPSKVGF